MRLRVTPGGRVGGEAIVPGDKSIAHRWLIVAATARGTSQLAGLPRSLDTRSTAMCLAGLVGAGRPALEAWASRPAVAPERNGSTWNRTGSRPEHLEVEGEGRGSLVPPAAALDCANSGTTIRLLAGVVAACPFTTVLMGDPSLSRRPMERVARPLRAMGARVTTDDGRPPLEVTGGPLHGIGLDPDVPSAQVKGSVLFAALAAEGTTTVTERATTRDHTERLLRAIGAPVRFGDGRVEVDGPSDVPAFEGQVPGDPSAAAFLVGAAALTGTELGLTRVGLNPSRLRWLEVMRRMGVPVSASVEGEEVGEPFGRVEVAGATGVRPVSVPSEELPLVIDEVPILAALAAHADGASRFEGGAELRVKESDRLAALVAGLRGLGGEVELEGDDLVVAGGGLRGGAAEGADDHRIAMALVVAALAAQGPCEIDGVDVADVSFPGFVPVLRSLGAGLEELP